MSKNLIIYTVYFNPSDYPGKYVVRGYEIDGINPDGKPLECEVYETLNQAREPLSKLGLYLLDRHMYDDACIVEVWL